MTAVFGEGHLLLFKYMLYKLGYSSFEEARERLRNHSEFIDSLGNVLMEKIPQDGIWGKYKDVIQNYVDRLRENRKKDFVTLKYFQYLAVLFTELFFEEFIFDREKKIFVPPRDFIKTGREIVDRDIVKFVFNKQSDLAFNKLAYWMATGSGKTLIMHINYFQMMEFARRHNIQWNNVLLITPNEGLSRQHVRELQKSGIDAVMYDGNLREIFYSSKSSHGDMPVIVIDIYKLKVGRQSAGGGKTIDVDTFIDSVNPNLVFIDEGHKGLQSTGNDKESKTWKAIRDKLVESGGFTFEYSATFGQVIDVPSSFSTRRNLTQKDKIFKEYAKSIVFAYPYKYFYQDGYGKDFYVVNMKNAVAEGKMKKYYTDLLLTYALLSFFESVIAYKEKNREAKELGIEKPLWAFVGNTVNLKGTKNDIKKISDVLDVLSFIKAIVEEPSTLRRYLEDVLEKDVLQLIPPIMTHNDKVMELSLLREHYMEKSWNYNALIRDIYRYIFHRSIPDSYEFSLDNGEKLILYLIEGIGGEIGLGLSSSGRGQFFGVINIGDASKFIKDLNEIAHMNIEAVKESFVGSLFDSINEVDSSINILIGSRKFTEGWNTWRLSSLTLLNIGQGKGPLIIQLFGRGVRLKGRNMSLKREMGLGYALNVLQTLYITGLNANYIESFIETIRREGLGDIAVISVPIRFNHRERWENKLYVLDYKKENLNREVFSLEEVSQGVVVNYGVRLHVYEGFEEENGKLKEKDYKFSENALESLDFNKIYNEVLGFISQNGYYNVVINKKILRKIVRNSTVRIVSGSLPGIALQGKYLVPVSMEGLQLLYSIAVQISKRYIEEFYRSQVNEVLPQYAYVSPIADKVTEIVPKDEEIRITVEGTQAKETVLSMIRDFIEDGKIPDSWLLGVDSLFLHWDNHLYTPLTWENSKYMGQIKNAIVEPAPLKESERQFIEDLDRYIREKNLTERYEIYLLRNLPKRGIGLFYKVAFYPDFILWIVDKEKGHMYISFVDPKGLEHAGEIGKDKKIAICSEVVPNIDKSIKEEYPDVNISAFILSVTPYDDVYKKHPYPKNEFEEKHVLFMEDGDYMNKLFGYILKSVEVK